VKISQRTEPIGRAEVEQEIVRLCDELERMTEDFASFARRAAVSEADWKRREAGHIVDGVVSGNKASEYVRRSEAMKAHGAEYELYKLDAATRDVTEERLRSVRAQLSALQTIAANVRSQS
jgi:hypothetical protein